jgi:beta-glucosidase
MTDTRTFPDGFLWGAATAAHQVEGDNLHSDFWEWETDPTSRVPVAEPSGSACDHWHRYREDIGILADLGLNAYRFSVEWARIEPWAGEFDDAALEHYSQVVDACLERGVTPVVTLQHFTLPAWVAHAGGWLNADIVEYFARYTAKVVDRIGDRVRYVCTINEPGNMIVRAYLGTFPTPPFVQDLDSFDAAAAAVNRAHRAAREVIKQARPDARVGMAHALQDWRANTGGAPVMQWARELHEDRFLAETADDDFIGVQTYTRIDVDAPAAARALTALVLRSRRLTEALVLPVLRRSSAALEHGAAAAKGERVTQMGWPWAPTAVEVTARRMAARFPGKELLITEHGVGTAHDPERIEFIYDALAAVHRMIQDGLPVTGYLHWSLLDNFEWWDGYRPTFGLVAVDRVTQARSVKPSARWYGAVAAANRLLPDPGRGTDAERAQVTAAGGQ